MTNRERKLSIILAIIGGLITLIAAVINVYPWSNSKRAKKIYLKVFSGVVIDSANDGLSHAEVTVAGRRESYYTEQNGNFRLVVKDDLPYVRILVRKTGYRNYDKSFDLPDTTAVIILQSNGLQR